MFDALCKYNTNLQHAKSKLLGTKQDDAKYYNRIGSSGNYRYFYTKAEWDAYQEGLKRTAWEKEQKEKKEREKLSANQSGSKIQAETEAKKKAEWEENQKQIKAAEESLAKKQEDMAKSKQQNENYEKNKAAAEAVTKAEQKKYNDLYKENNPRRSYAQEQAKEEAKEYTKWREQNFQKEAKKKEDRKKIDEGLAKISEESKRKLADLQVKSDAIKREKAEYNKNFNKNAKKAEEERKNRANEIKEEVEQIEKEKEEAFKKDNYVEWYKQNNAELIEQNSQDMRMNPDSPLNIMEGIIDYETYSTEEEFYDLAIDYKTGELTRRLAEHDEDIQNIYEWIADNKETEETDPKTGLKIKNYELTTEEEMKIVNPGYYYSDQQYDITLLYGAEFATVPTGYANNCYACTQAMALRKQGYDVTPGSDFDGIPNFNTDSEIGMSYDDLWTGHFTDFDDYSKIYKKNSKEPVGSYGDYVWSYNDGTQWCGHSIFYEVKADGVHYYDCQNGQEYSEDLLKTLVNNAARYEDGSSSYSARYKRLDNQTFKGAKKMKSAKKISKTNTNNDKGGLVNESK